MKNTLIGLHAQTSIHAGTGQNTGTIDLPIQRESHSAYPCIYGSSMKGALRACAQQRKLKNINDLFGPESTDIGYAGALLISDARLLLLPIRSLTTQFRWVTCPAILQRLKQDSERFDNKFEFDVPSINNDNNNDNYVMIDKNSDKSEKLYLEEYCFNAIALKSEGLVKVLAQFIQFDDAESLLKKQLAIISNDDFTYLAKNATPVRARNVLTPEKTSKNLWYEESLPPETIMYMGVSADNVRQKDSAIKADKILDDFHGLFTKNKWLQVGGNETVGMGWFAVKEINNTEDGGI